jgi:hypothetical protein
MRFGRVAVSLGLAWLILTSRADAQSLTPGPPGPFVIDLRGVTSGIPSGAGLYPSLPAGTSVPARGFGFDVGGHVYLFTLGPARLGVGANVLRVRGTATDATTTLQIVSPQVSFNFGTADGWSYLSAGFGTAKVDTSDGDTSASSNAVNAGGGARWFLNRHLAIGFDLRVLKVAADGETMDKFTTMSASVGVSIR